MSAVAVIATKWINGQEKTRDEVAAENIGLVKKVAARYELKAKKVGLDFEDLVSLGSIGLVKAYDNFNDQLGFRFSTYAVPKILGEITRGIHETNAGAHYPVPVRRIADKIQMYELENKSLEEIAEALNTTKKRAQQALEYLTQGLPNSLDMPMPSKNGEGFSLFDEVVGAEHDFSPVIVNEFAQELKPIEKEILLLLMKEYNRKEIGQMKGCSYQAIGYHVERIRAKWNLYQYGLPANKKKRALEKMLDEQDREEMLAMLQRLKARQRIRKMEMAE